MGTRQGACGYGGVVHVRYAPLNGGGSRTDHDSATGRSGIEVTMTIYAHASLDEKRTALQRLGQRLA